MPIGVTCRSPHTQASCLGNQNQRHLARARGSWRACAGPKEQQLTLDNDRLTKAAVRYAAGLKEGQDEDDLVAKELGKSCAKALKGDPREPYKDALKAKISQRARELQKEADASNLLFVAGRKYYERGNYEDATMLFVQALKEQSGGGDSRLGGDIQLWLGLAYQATGKERESIALFKEVEKLHPLRTVRKQAANLRYIMEAPKLARGPDEVVSLPLLNSAVKPVRRGSGKPRLSRTPPRKLSEDKLKRLDDWENVPLPAVLKTRTAAWLIGLLAVALAIASVALRD